MIFCVRDSIIYERYVKKFTMAKVAVKCENESKFDSVFTPENRIEALVNFFT